MRLRYTLVGGDVPYNYDVLSVCSRKDRFKPNFVGLPLGEGGLRAPEGEKFRMAKSRKTDEVFIKSFVFYLIRLVPRHLPQGEGFKTSRLLYL